MPTPPGLRHSAQAGAGVPSPSATVLAMSAKRVVPRMVALPVHPDGVQPDGRKITRIILQEMTVPEEVPPSASVARVARAPPAVRAAAASVALVRQGGCMAALRSPEISLDARSEEHTSELQSPCNLV